MKTQAKNVKKLFYFLLFLTFLPLISIKAMALSITGDRMLSDGWNGHFVRESAEADNSTIHGDGFNASAWSQRWEIIAVSGANNTYRLRNHWTGDYLTANSTTNWDDVYASSLNTSNNQQKWSFHSLGGDTYHIQNQYSGKYLTAPEHEDATVRQALLDGGWSSQEFTLSEIGVNPTTAGSSDYMIEAELSVSGTPENRWDSVAGMAIESPFSSANLSSVSFDVRADVGQGFWVYLRDAAGNDLATHYNTTASQGWQTITLQASDFGNNTSGTIDSVQFFIGYNSSSDVTPDNTFYFDNLVVTATGGEKQGARGLVDEFGTGWLNIGYGQVSMAELRSDPATTPTTVTYNIQYQRSGGDDFYVSPNGSDTNNGSINSPFKTPQKAADLAGPGDRIILKSGTYSNGSADNIIKLQNSGTASNWISIEAEQSGSVTFNVDKAHGVLIHGASYVRIKGLKIKGIADTLTPSQAEALRQQNWYSQGLYGVGIGTESREISSGNYSFPHHIIIQNNTISWMSAGGIAMKRADYMLIKNNKVHNCAYYNVWAPSGISVWENHNFDTAFTYRTVITGNISHSNYNHFKFYASSNPDTADSYTDGNGIIIDALAIDQGYLNDGQGGIYSGKTLIDNNIVYNNGGKGINIYASDNVDVIHNTAYKNGTHPEVPGEVGLGNTSNTRLINNIIYAKNSEEVFFHYQTANLNITDNIIYKDIALTGSDNVNISSNHINQNPNFSSVSNNDFTLQSNSPAIDAGTDLLTNSKDKAGVNRPQGGAVDMGAYEN